MCSNYDQCLEPVQLLLKSQISIYFCSRINLRLVGVWSILRDGVGVDPVCVAGRHLIRLDQRLELLASCPSF